MRFPGAGKNSFYAARRQENAIVGAQVTGGIAVDYRMKRPPSVPVARSLPDFALALALSLRRLVWALWLWLARECPLERIWRIASTMFWPCETRTSTCRNFATICSGLAMSDCRCNRGQHRFWTAQQRAATTQTPRRPIGAGRDPLPPSKWSPLPPCYARGAARDPPAQGSPPGHTRRNVHRDPYPT
jgi:hypothetical protein